MDETRTLLANGWLAPFHGGLTTLPVLADYGIELLSHITSDDVTCGYSYLDNDVCVSAVASAGQYIRHIQAHGDLSDAAVLSSPLCHDCRAVSLARLIKGALTRAGLTRVDVIELTDADLHAAAPSAETTPPSCAAAEPGKRIGIFGPIPVLLTPEFNRAVVDRLEVAGLTAVLAPLTPLIGQRDVYEPALAHFASQGVSTAIGILPFGCMSGNAYARGRLRVLQKRFAPMQITFLDYDPSAADINTVNRVELVIQSMIGY